ncbi:CheR family methyltransferase [Clostridium tunisiense]|uniref:CheR family methyltransferase n=1 Tax=Clostridium tunisiense TaxID=219748 RepID=UPI00030A2764|nr:protein-glutamate O-methyltransferase CheR [Clostridium tunisiense]
MKMQISIKENNIKEVLVMGNISSRDEIDSLIRELNEGECEKVHITFFDANMIHVDIVEKLNCLYEKALCNIYIFKRYLYSYLYNLGIRAKYIGNKLLNRCYGEYENTEKLKEDEVRDFLEDINNAYGYDYRGYQIQSIVRRINISMIRSNIKSLSEFRKAVNSDSNILEQLFLDFSINTTEFFRDPEVFKVLREQVLPKLNTFNHIKIWCVGCSIGKEPYSLAIMLHELGLLNKTQIYATDINPYVIEEGKNGLFTKRDLEKEIVNYNSAQGEKNFLDYFDVKDQYIKIKSFLKEKILFFSHSLISNGNLNEFTLILCRNVLIYFTPELQGQVLENFYDSLDRNGFLVLGKSEGLMLNGGERYFKDYMEREKIFIVK